MKVMKLKIKQFLKKLHMYLNRSSYMEDLATRDESIIKDQSCLFCPERFKCNCYNYGKICRENEHKLINDIKYEKWAMDYEKCGCDEPDLIQEDEISFLF